MRFVAVVLTFTISALWAGAASADPPFAPHAPTDASHRYSRAEPAAPRPEYLTPTWIDPRLNAVVTRITGDSGAAIPHITGSRWGSDGRHQYSVRAAWSANDSLIYIENGDCNDCLAMHNGSRCSQTAESHEADCGVSTSPSKLLLDGSTYIPITPSAGLTAAFDKSQIKEFTWHPQIAAYMILVTDSTTTKSRLQWLDVRDGSIQRSWELPIKLLGIGPFEGNPSNDGLRIALISAVGESVIVVDMNRAGNTAISTPYVLPACGLCTTSNPCQVGRAGGSGHVGVSSMGGFLDVAYKNDFHRIFDIDWHGDSTPPEITGPHPMAANSRRCYSGTTLQDTSGWIMPLKHADFVTYESEEYIAGFESCYSETTVCAGPHQADVQDDGRVVLVKLSDGSVRHISLGKNDSGSDGVNEQSGAHLSARNLEGGLATWIFASYEKIDNTSGVVFDDSTGATRMRGEVVAWSLGTTKEVRRLAWSHSSWSQGDQLFDCYRAQPQPCPSRDGRRVLLASNWRRHVYDNASGDTLSWRPNTWRKSYVIDTRPTPKAIADLANDPAGAACSITLHWTAPVNDIVSPTSDTLVAAYDVRYSLDTITEENFYDQATVAPPTPLAAGHTQTLVVGGLGSDDTYWFAVKAIGTHGPRSGRSNLVSAVRVQLPPHDPPWTCD